MSCLKPDDGQAEDILVMDDRRTPCEGGFRISPIFDLRRMNY